MEGYYYLHTNGDLIFKNAFVVESDPNYFDSDFVKKVWSLDIANRADAWTIILESLALGASINRVRELCSKWNCNLKDFEEILLRVKPTELMRDGATIFLRDILNLDVDKYWDELMEKNE